MTKLYRAVIVDLSKMTVRIVRTPVGGEQRKREYPLRFDTPHGRKRAQWFLRHYTVRTKRGYAWLTVRPNA